MTQNRFYSSVAVKTTLNGTITAGATTLVVASATGFPASLPYTLILERDTANEEVVTVTGVSSLTLTVTRAQDGTTGVSHATGAVVEHGVSARDFNEPQAHIAASSAVHGITGSVVGTSDAQTLTNKTLTTPTVADFTNAGHTHHAAASGGQLAQADTHGSPDTDASAAALHHTIGVGATQAAAGSHNHSGVYSATGHTHAEADVTSLVSDLAGKAATSHTHVIANITDIANASVSHATTADSASAVTWTNVSGKPLTTIKGGEATVTFTAGLATFAHGMGTTPTGAVVQKVDGGSDGTVIGFNGPTAWDATNLYLRCSTGTTGFAGGYTFGWIAFA